MRKHILLFTVISVALVFNSINNSHFPVADIYDPLSPENETSLFEGLIIEAGYDVTSYTNQDATVNSFKSIPSEASLIIMRVHSSINHGNVWVFTGEPYSNEKHSIDQLVDNVHRARTHPEGDYLFALGSGFFYDHVPELDGAQVLVLGCDAAASNDLADVFLERGASSYVSWDGPVSLEFTDEVFVKIVTLIVDGVGADSAVEIVITEYGRDPHFNSSLICIKQ